MNQYVTSGRPPPASQLPLASSPTYQPTASSASHVPNLGTAVSPLQASQLPLAPAPLGQQQATSVSQVANIRPRAPAGYQSVQPIGSLPQWNLPSVVAPPSQIADASVPGVEVQLLEYLNDSFSYDAKLSEAVIQQLVSSAGSRPLKLNIKTKDEISWPLLHLVVLNTGTPAPALENIVAYLIQVGATPEAEDDDGDSALAALLALAHEHKADGEALSENTLDAQLGAIVALLHSKSLKVAQKEVEQVCCWLRHFAPTKDHARKRVLDALAKHVGERYAASAWCSEELLTYLDSRTFDARRPVEAKVVLNFLEKGASPRHSQNGATALLMIVLNPYNCYEELLPIFRAMLEKDPGCAAIKDGFKLLPLQWAADYRSISSQHNLAKPNPASLLALLPSIVEKLPAHADAGEVCMNIVAVGRRRDKETVLPHLESRFKEGDRVLCRVQIPGGTRIWEEGVVVDVWYREDCWPDSHPGAPYEVLLDIGTRVFALVDHDKIIRGIKAKQDVPIPKSTGGKKSARFQRRQRDDGSWELLDTVSGKARPIQPDSEGSEN